MNRRGGQTEYEAAPFVASREDLGAGDFLFIALVAGCGCHGRGGFVAAVQMKQRRGLLTEPSQQQARPSRRRCDPGIRHSLTEEHGPVEDSLTVAPRSSLHESAGFLSLVAERPPKAAVDFHPRSALTFKCCVMGSHKLTFTDSTRRRKLRLTQTR